MCTLCLQGSGPCPEHRVPPAPREVFIGLTPRAWRDRQGDIWRLGDDGLLHTPETAPFSREHVERKWGPLEPIFTESP